jgi:acetoin utilization protein AcuB
MSRAIRRFMTNSPLTVTRTTTLDVAHRLMREHEIRHLPVLDDGAIVGIVSLGDLHLLETIAEFALDSVHVDEAMTPSPYVASPDTPVEEVVEHMAAHKYGCAIIANGDGEVEGIFTTIDAMRVLAKVFKGPRP